MEMNAGLKDVKDGDFQVRSGSALKSHVEPRRFWAAFIDRTPFIPNRHSCPSFVIIMKIGFSRSLYSIKEFQKQT